MKFARKYINPKLYHFDGVHLQVIKMAEQNSVDMYNQTYMLVWDVNLKILNKAYNVDIFLPLFCLTSTEIKKKNWIRIETYNDVLNVQSNLTSIKEFKRCTTFIMDPTTEKVRDVYRGFEKFTWNKNGWSDKMQFVFELEMQCDSSAVRPVIWKRFITKLKPSINPDGILLNLDSEKVIHVVRNNQGVSCVAERYPTNPKEHNITVIPEDPSKNWNLLTTAIVRTKENNLSERYYFHTTSTGWQGRCFADFKRFVIFEINELSISLEDMGKLQICDISSEIIAHLTPAIVDKEKQLENASSSLLEYFTTMKICDILIHVQDQQIRAHKIVLSDNSTIWHDLFIKDETLATLHIVDFDYDTIEQLIAYMYTGKIKQVTDQLLIASDTYGVAGLKKLCEEELITTINMKSVVNLLVMADRYKAVALYDKVMEFTVENRAAFKELEEAKAMFMIYPELTFKLSSKIF